MPHSSAQGSVHMVDCEECVRLILERDAASDGGDFVAARRYTAALTVHCHHVHPASEKQQCLAE
ncbi:hypothetical protein AB0A70_20885 [Streptomyces morookaense]|uniref:hypothetical protein n=1 Tax=Streptomyces morookaense TaxID=1970 RepID=UPI0033D6F64F